MSQSYGSRWSTRVRKAPKRYGWGDDPSPASASSIDAAANRPLASKKRRVEGQETLQGPATPSGEASVDASPRAQSQQVSLEGGEDSVHEFGVGSTSAATKLPVMGVFGSIPSLPLRAPPSSTAEPPVPAPAPARAPSPTPARLPFPEQNASRPQPCGTPPVWADARHELCSALPYFMSYQGGSYTSDKLAYGLMIGEDKCERPFFDEEVVITRAGGECSSVKGEMVQDKDQNRHNFRVSSFQAALDKGHAVVLIVGRENRACPTEPLHTFSVLAHFQVTNVWAEKNLQGRVAFKFRFEKIYLGEKSWWAPQGSPNPPSARDFSARAASFNCVTCETPSVQVYRRWMCLNEHCEAFWKIYDAPPSDDDLVFNPLFLSQRTAWPADHQPIYSLEPALPDTSASENAIEAYERRKVSGIVCPVCKRCNARVFWNRWECGSPACTFRLEQEFRLVGAAEASSSGASRSGAQASSARYSAHITASQPVALGNWQVTTYTLCQGNTVTHFQANQSINSAAGGTDWMFNEMQREKRIDLSRGLMEKSVVKGGLLASHFSTNYGLHYSFVVKVDTKDLGTAPDVILRALERMTWAGQTAAGMNETYKEPNELLAVRYIEAGKMEFHDDGERSLEPTIATLSLGAPATMFFRMKSRYYQSRAKSGLYIEDGPILDGSLEAARHRQLRNLKPTLSRETFLARVGELLGDKKVTPPEFLQLTLRHGDIIVMHGAEMQKYFEHKVANNGKLRFALTARNVKPEFVDEKDHGKGEIDQARKQIYRGE